MDFLPRNGDKLELDNLKPEAFEVKTKTKAQNHAPGQYHPRYYPDLAILIIVVGVVSFGGRLTDAALTEQPRRT